ncbi:MAG: amidohydrolase [Clostridia bacterium]|nr:amidohydrolase [Clostridia bacterium]
MKILFEKARLLDNREVYLLTDGDKITYIGKDKPDESADRIVNCSGKILMSGLYNTHSHIAMTAFRGMGGDLPLMKWLDDVILPAEDKMDSDMAKASAFLGAAEMIKSGIISFSDMYMFSESTAEVALVSGMKANVSRGLVAFDDNASVKGDFRFEEALRTYDRYHGRDNGRIKIDFAVHAEYTARERFVREVVEAAKEKNVRLQTHLSESRSEAEKCIAKRNMTQTQFFDMCGYFDLPVTLAHCVHLSDVDKEILAGKDVYIAHNPVSNLKLASGIMPYADLLERGFRISLGSDGAASNNSQDIFKEMNFAALLAKGTTESADRVKASDVINSATRMGALSQGREDSGLIEVGYKADIILVDTANIENTPSRDAEQTIVFSASARDVALTMCDGKILYENGEFKTLDIERILFDVKRYI